jgi:hypothetical protein
VFARDRLAIVAVGVDGGDISGEDRGHAGKWEGVGKGVGMAQLPAVRERTIGGSRGPIRIAAMPERPGQPDKGGDPDVLPVAKGGIAILVGPIQRGGRFEMRKGCTVIAAEHQGRGEDAMADQERAGRGLRLGWRQEVGGVLERGRHRPSGEVRHPKPPKHGEMERAPDWCGLGHEPVRSLQLGDDLGVCVALTGHQRCGQGDVDIELQLSALAGFG